MFSLSPDKETSLSIASNSDEYSFIEEVKHPEPDIEKLNIKSTTMMENIKTETNNNFLNPDHPLMIKYQRDLKERLLSLLRETDEQLTLLKRTITAQEAENRHFAERGYELQKELKLQEEKLQSIHSVYEDKNAAKEKLVTKREQIRKDFQSIEETWNSNIKKDLDFQSKLEDAAFEVVQLTSLQTETFTDANTLKRAVEKSTKDRENLEVQKLRQDLLISRLENDKFNLEDKINLYKIQSGIKKEEATDLRKELNAANSEMETIKSEKQQIVHHWKQSLVSLEKQDRVLGEIGDVSRKCQDAVSTLNMDISATKKTVRKELERNEQLVGQMQFRESDIARVQKELKDTLERERDLLENLSVLDQTVEITEQETQIIKEKILLKEKELEAKTRELQRFYEDQKILEKKHMDMLHQKMTITKASKYTEKLIKDIRNSIRLNEEKGAHKENEKEKLILKLENLLTFVSNMENNLNEMQKERIEKETLFNKSEVTVLKAKEKMDGKRSELRLLEIELREMITKAGGQELGPFERELESLKKEIVIAEQGKRNMEKEYLRFQNELFASSKQSAVKTEENDFYHKKISIMEGKKIQLEADIEKEEKEIKDIQNRIQRLLNETAQVNKILFERKEVQENLLQTCTLTKGDYTKVLKEAELHFLQKKNDLKLLKRKKKKHLRKLFEVQRHIVYWEGKINLAEQTRKILKSTNHLNEFADIRSEIRRLQLKFEYIKKAQEDLSKDLEKAVYRHTSLYVEADKQALFGKRRKTPEYVQKRIKHAQKKVREDKKELENCKKQLEVLNRSKSELDDSSENEKLVASELINKIKSVEYSVDNKEKEKRQNIIKLSFEQKRMRFLQKVLDGTYIRAVRNENRRPEEIEKLLTGLRAVQVIAQAAMNEYPNLHVLLRKVMDYIFVSKKL